MAAIVLLSALCSSFGYKKAPLTYSAKGVEKENAPTEIRTSIKDELKTNPRCHLEFTAKLCTCRILTYPRQITHALALQNTLRICAFDCTLRGPFDDLFLTRLSATQALCTGIIAFISASTVWRIKTCCYNITAHKPCQ